LRFSDSGNVARVESGAVESWGVRLLTLHDNGMIRLFFTICDLGEARRLYL